MKMEDILKLKEGGFTAQEIVQLAQVMKNDEVAQPAQEPKQEPVKEVEKKEVEPEIDPLMAVLSTPVVEKKEVTKPAPAASNSDPMQSVIDQLAALTAAIQGSALKQTKLDIKEENAEDALASILM